MGDQASSEPRIVVLGLGNVLMGDDAVGPYAVEWLLASQEFPPGVSVIDAGTPGLDLSPFIVDARALIVIDTVRSDGSPGTVKLYRRDQLLATAPQPRLSPHDPGLQETLLLLDLHGRGPDEVLLVGVIPEKVQSVIGLSDAARAALPRVASEVVAELERLGAAPRPRADARAPEPWWERPAVGEGGEGR